MNKRLTCIASHVPVGLGLADIGTDHGYLPVELAKRGYPGNLIASDIRPGPLQAAQKSAKEAGLTNRIRFYLCDGISPDEAKLVDTIVIAGMGGDTICGILDRAEFCYDPRYTLLLQPMTRAEVLRYWLINNEFGIEEEDLVEDGGILYSVCKARFGKKTVLNEAELFTGSFAMLRDHPLFSALLHQQMERFQKMITGLEQTLDTRGRLPVLRTIQTQLEEMLER